MLCINRKGTMFLCIVFWVVLVFYSHKALGVSQPAENEGKLQAQKDKDQRKHLCQVSSWEPGKSAARRVRQKPMYQLCLTVSGCFFLSLQFKLKSACASLSNVFQSIVHPGGFLSIFCPEALHLSSNIQVTRNR